MFARVISTQVGRGAVDAAISAARLQLPDARQQHGFAGFYLLAGRESGKLMTISLWHSRADVLAVEEHAAQVRGEAARSMGVAAPAVDIHEVAVQAAG